jgi:hypothetical protein
MEVDGRKIRATLRVCKSREHAFVGCGSTAFEHQNRGRGSCHVRGVRKCDTDSQSFDFASFRKRCGRTPR